MDAKAFDSVRAKDQKEFSNSPNRDSYETNGVDKPLEVARYQEDKEKAEPKKRLKLNAKGTFG